MRESINFNNNWRFKRLGNNDKCGSAYAGIDFDDSRWEEVAVPHTPKIEPLLVNDMWRGLCWYRKTFHLNAVKGKRVFLEFEGVMIVAEVWVNGARCATHKGGYLPFTVDISDVVNYGEDNLVALGIDNRDDPDIPPGKPLELLDFCWYGGIYRNVRLVVKDKLHITDAIFANQVAKGGVLVSYPKATEDEALVRVQTHVQNDYEVDMPFSILNTVATLDGKIVARQESARLMLKAGQDLCVLNTVRMKKPLLWSPEFPHLYNLQTTILAGREEVDREATRIGIRRLRISADGFFINGRKQYLRGTNRHQEYPFIGYALSDNAQYRDARNIKEAGFDIVRLSHYPQAPAFMDACDELGLLVMDAIPGWQAYKEGEFAELCLRNTREMIRRDRNHPSVVLWETSLNETYGMSDKIIAKLHAIVHEEIPGDQAWSCGWKNKYYDVFIPARQHTNGPSFWNNWKNGKKAIFTAEYGDCEYRWIHYRLSNFKQEISQRDYADESCCSRQRRGDGEQRMLRQAFNFQESHNQNRLCKAMIGDANWVFADYNRGYTTDHCESGVVDIFRLPKFVWHFYRSQRDAGYQAANFSAGPMAFVAGYWAGKMNGAIKVFSNCDEVELLLNGKSLGRQKPDKDRTCANLPHPPFTFRNIAFAPGVLKAVGYIGGCRKAQHVVKTPGRPKAIEIEFDFRGKPLAADGADAVFAYARITDENGTLVPGAKNKVRFKVQGPARLVGKNPVKAEAGIATLLLQGESIPGKVVVTASSPGLTSARKIVQTKGADGKAAPLRSKRIMAAGNINLQLQDALQAGKTTVARDLILRGAVSGILPMLFAESKYKAIIRFLVKKDIDVHAKSNFDGNTPLSWAAYEGKKEMVEFLIAMGADIRAREDHFGKTPLHLAAEEGHLDVVKFLVGKGADIDARDNAGLTPVQFARLNGHPDVVKFLVGKRARVNR